MKDGKKGQGAKGKGGKGKGAAWAREVRPATSGVAEWYSPPLPSPWFEFEPDRLEPESSSNQGG